MTQDTDADTTEPTKIPSDPIWAGFDPSNHCAHMDETCVCEPDATEPAEPTRLSLAGANIVARNLIAIGDLSVALLCPFLGLDPETYDGTVPELWATACAALDEATEQL